MIIIVAGRPDIAELQRYSSCLSITLSPVIITLLHEWSTRRHVMRMLRARRRASCSTARGAPTHSIFFARPPHQASIRVFDPHIGADVMYKSSLRTVQPNSLRMSRRKCTEVKPIAAPHIRTRRSPSASTRYHHTVSSSWRGSCNTTLHDRKCDDGMIFDGEGNKHNF